MKIKLKQYENEELMNATKYKLLTERFESEHNIRIKLDEQVKGLYKIIENEKKERTAVENQLSESYKENRETLKSLTNIKVQMNKMKEELEEVENRKLMRMNTMISSYFDVDINIGNETDYDLSTATTDGISKDKDNSEVYSFANKLRVKPQLSSSSPIVINEAPKYPVKKQTREIGINTDKVDFATTPITNETTNEVNKLTRSPSISVQINLSENYEKEIDILNERINRKDIEINEKDELINTFKEKSEKRKKEIDDINSNYSYIQEKYETLSTHFKDIQYKYVFYYLYINL